MQLNYEKAEVECGACDCDANDCEFMEAMMHMRAGVC
jgi:hypothetical protein